MAAAAAGAATAAGDPGARKKRVRFASLEERDEEEDEEGDDGQEEDTLFDKRTEERRTPRGGGREGAPRREQRRRGGGEDDGEGGRGGEGEGGCCCRRRGACGRWMVTLALCASFLGLGMSISVIGPTFQDLASNVQKNISGLSSIFVGRSAGYMCGSLLGGLLFDCCPPLLLLGASMLVTAGGMLAVPFCTRATLLNAIMAAIGVSMGTLDTGGNVLILQTWAELSGPHMQALHFSFAAGAFVSPLIAKLIFGPDRGCGATVAVATANGSAATPPTATDRVGGAADGPCGSLASMWAYVVIGSFVLLDALFFFALFCRRGGTAQDKGRSAAGRPPVAKNHTAMVALLFFFFFAYVGAEVAYGSFIFTFATDLAGLDAARAAGVNSLFWGSFAACRGAAILVAACVYPGTMIALSLLGATASSLLLSLFGRAPPVLWLGSALYGASMAAVFPSSVSWAEQYTHVTGRTAAAFVVGAALGEMVLPATLGALLGRFPRQPLLMYAALLATAFAAILFPVIFKLATPSESHAHQPGGRGRGRPEDGEDRRALLQAGGAEDEEDEEEGEGEGENEADQWNDADFEVIEMDEAAGPADFPGEPAGGAAPGPTGDLPGSKLLQLLDREKAD